MAVVAGAGMLSQANIRQLRQSDTDYVVAARLGGLRGAARSRITDLDQYDPPDAYGVRLLDTEHGGHRLIELYDPQYAARDRAKRQEAIAKAKRHRREGRIRSYKYLKYRGETQLDHDRIERDAALDSLHGVYTSLDLDAATVRGRYADL